MPGEQAELIADGLKFFTVQNLAFGNASAQLKDQRGIIRRLVKFDAPRLNRVIQQRRQQIGGGLMPDGGNYLAPVLAKFADQFLRLRQRQRLITKRAVRGENTGVE